MTTRTERGVYVAERGCDFVRFERTRDGVQEATILVPVTAVWQDVDAGKPMALGAAINKAKAGAHVTRAVWPEGDVVRVCGDRIVRQRAPGADWLYWDPTHADLLAEDYYVV
jgi:hypothetical protein